MREYGTQLLLVRLYTYSHFGHFCTFILCWQIHDLKKEQRITVLDFSASSIPSVHLYVFRRVTMVIYYKSIYCDNRANWSQFNNKGGEVWHVQCSAQYYLDFYSARGSHRVRLKTVFFPISGNITVHRAVYLVHSFQVVKTYLENVLTRTIWFYRNIFPVHLLPFIQM